MHASREAGRRSDIRQGSRPRRDGAYDIVDGSLQAAIAQVCSPSTGRSWPRRSPRPGAVQRWPWLMQSARKSVRRGAADPVGFEQRRRPPAHRAIYPLRGMASEAKHRRRGGRGHVNGRIRRADIVGHIARWQDIVWPTKEATNGPRAGSPHVYRPRECDPIPARFRPEHRVSEYSCSRNTILTT